MEIALPRRQYAGRGRSADVYIFVNVFLGSHSAIIEPVPGISLAPNEKRPGSTAATTDSTVLIARSPVSGQVLSNQVGGSRAVYCSPVTSLQQAGEVLWVGLQDGTVSVISLASNTEVSTFPNYHKAPVLGFTSPGHAGSEGTEVRLVYSYTANGELRRWTLPVISSVSGSGSDDIQNVRPEEQGRGTVVVKELLGADSPSITDVVIGTFYTQNQDAIVAAVEQGDDYSHPKDSERSSDRRSNQDHRVFSSASMHSFIAVVMGDSCRIRCSLLSKEDGSLPKSGNTTRVLRPAPRSDGSDVKHAPMSLTCAAADSRTGSLWVGTSSGELLGWRMLTTMFKTEDTDFSLHFPDVCHSLDVHIGSASVAAVRVRGAELIVTASNGRYCILHVDDNTLAVTPCASSDSPPSPHSQQELAGKEGNSSNSIFTRYVAPMFGHLLMQRNREDSMEECLFVPSTDPAATAAFPTVPPPLQLEIRQAMPVPMLQLRSESLASTQRMVPPSSGNVSSRKTHTTDHEVFLEGSNLEHAFQDATRKSHIYIDSLRSRIRQASATTQDHLFVIGPSKHRLAVHWRETAQRGADRNEGLHTRGAITAAEEVRGRPNSHSTSVTRSEPLSSRSQVTPRTNTQVFESHKLESGLVNSSRPQDRFGVLPAGTDAADFYEGSSVSSGRGSSFTQASRTMNGANPIVATIECTSVASTARINSPQRLSRSSPRSSARGTAPQPDGSGVNATCRELPPLPSPPPPPPPPLAAKPDAPTIAHLQETIKAYEDEVKQLRFASIASLAQKRDMQAVSERLERLKEEFATHRAASAAELEVAQEEKASLKRENEELRGAIEANEKMLKAMGEEMHSSNDVVNVSQRSSTDRAGGRDSRSQVLPAMKSLDDPHFAMDGEQTNAERVRSTHAEREREEEMATLFKEMDALKCKERTALGAKKEAEDRLLVAQEEVLRSQSEVARLKAALSAFEKDTFARQQDLEARMARAKRECDELREQSVRDNVKDLRATLSRLQEHIRYVEQEHKAELEQVKARVQASAASERTQRETQLQREQQAMDLLRSQLESESAKRVAAEATSNNAERALHRTERIVNELRQVITVMDAERRMERDTGAKEHQEELHRVESEQKRTHVQRYEEEKAMWETQRASLHSTIAALQGELSKAEADHLSTHDKVALECAELRKCLAERQETVRLLETTVERQKRELAAEVQRGEGRRAAAEENLRDVRAQASLTNASMRDRLDAEFDKQLRDEAQRIHAEHDEKLATEKRAWEKAMNALRDEFSVEKQSLLSLVSQAEQRTDELVQQCAQLRDAVAASNSNESTVVSLQQTVAQLRGEHAEEVGQWREELNQERKRLAQERSSGEAERQALAARLRELEGGKGIQTARSSEPRSTYDAGHDQKLALQEKQLDRFRQQVSSQQRIIQNLQEAKDILLKRLGDSGMVNDGGGALLNPPSRNTTWPLAEDEIEAKEEEKVGKRAPTHLQPDEEDYFPQRKLSMPALHLSDSAKSKRNTDDENTIAGFRSSSIFSGSSRTGTVTCTSGQLTTTPRRTPRGTLVAYTPRSGRSTARRSPSHATYRHVHTDTHGIHCHLDDCVWCSGRVIQAMGGTFGVNSSSVSRAPDMTPVREGHKYLSPRRQWK